MSLIPSTAVRPRTPRPRRSIPPPRGALSDPSDPLRPAGPAWQIDPAAWATTQFATARLGHSGRTARLVTLAQQIARDPSSSLPRQTETWGDLKAAYRLLDRPEATFQALATPHWQLTREQADRGRFLIVDDTTEIDFGSKRQAAGLGPVGRGTGRGFLIHSALVVTPATSGWWAWPGRSCSIAGPLPRARR